MTISLCMIVRDEADNLAACLASARSLVDEMIVVDTGSRDRTVAIAQAAGANVQHYTWNHDFAAARNASLRHATGEWIFVLDADEVVQAAAIPALKAATQVSDALVVTFLRQELGDRQVPYSRVSRLFRRRSDLVFHRPYHELIDDAVLTILQQELDWRVIDLPEVALVHTGYQAEAISRRRKQEQAQAAMAGYLADHPGDAYIASKLGALYVDMGEVDRGLATLQQGLAAPQPEPAVRYELHYHLGCTYSQQQQLDRAADQFQQAIQQPIAATLKLGAYTNWGHLCLNHGDLQMALALFQQVVDIVPDWPIGQFNLAVVLKALGQWTAAITHYQRAIALRPDYAEAYQNLAVLWLKLGNVAESLHLFQMAIRLYDEAESPEADRLRAALLEMGFTV